METSKVNYQRKKASSNKRRQETRCNTEGKIEISKVKYQTNKQAVKKEDRKHSTKQRD